jgi:competence protein ComEA
MRTIIVVATALVLAAFSAPSFAQTSVPETQAAKPAKPAPAQPLNLNTATAAELEALPGIGVATAARIIEYRQKVGSFKKIEDLMNVRGIGEKMFLSLKPLIVVTPAKGTWS